MESWNNGFRPPAYEAYDSEKEIEKWVFKEIHFDF